MRDIALAVRRLRRQPSFAATVVGTLAVGLAAATALFAVVHATLLKPLPYPRAEDLYTVRTRMTDGRFTIGLVASEEISSLRRAAGDAIVGSAITIRSDLTILTDAGSRQVTAFGVSEGFFDLFGLPMTDGRPFAPDDYTASFVGGRVVLSHHAWLALFGGDPGVVGRTIHYAGGGNALVVGIAPAAFAIPREADLWYAQHFAETIGHGYDAYVRLKPGLTPAAIAGPLPPMWRALAQKYPDMETNRAFVVRPLLDAIVGDLGPIILIAFAATGLLLLLAMANVANLMLARGATRGREIAVRSALGASRLDVLRPLVAESFVIAAGAVLLGLPLATAALRAIVFVGGAAFPRSDGLHVDADVFAFSAALMALAALVIGLIPTAMMARSDPAALMNEGGRGGLHGRATRRLLGAMIVAEVTIAVALVAGAGRLGLSMRHLLAIDPGFRPEGRLVIDVQLPARLYVEPARAATWEQQVDERLRALGATAVGAASTLPLRPERDNTAFVDIANHPTDPANRPNGRIRVVTPELFDTLGIRIVAGRSFTRDDRNGLEPVVLVNRAWVRKFIPDLDPLRQRVNPGYFARTINGKVVATDAAIVGVVEDVPYSDLRKAAEPTVYVAEAQVPPSLMLRRSLVMTTADGRPERLIPEIRRELEKIDPNVPADFDLMSHAVSTSLVWPTLGLLLMATFGAAALVLAATGVLGVIAFVAAQRSGEMAVRLALGATRGHVFGLVVQHGAALAAQGLALGVLIAWWTGRLMSGYVYQVGAANAFVLGGSAALVLAVGLAATLLPARRAAMTQPAQVLKP
ncbi:MAG TPA: ADOP family duplicated permease [Vicinamibacterales bacterium]|nr:ADOP family duplicated permease [Vicinamibacterales bacterium]